MSLLECITCPTCTRKSWQIGELILPYRRARILEQLLLHREGISRDEILERAYDTGGPTAYDSAITAMVSDLRHDLKRVGWTVRSTNQNGGHIPGNYYLERLPE